jgi:hypothetical protein
MLAGQAHADIIPLSDNRSVSVSGYAQGHGAELQSYSQTATPAPFAPFNGSVNGSVDSTDASPAYPLDPLFTSHADGQSNQTSIIGTSRLAVSGNLRGREWIGQNGGSSAAAEMNSVFEVGFRVDAPIAYTLSAAPLLGFHQDSGGVGASSLFDFSLTSANHGVILNYYDFLGASLFGDSSGILQPDDYMLRLNASVSLVPDPLGDVAFAEYGVTFTVTPESAPTALLLGMAFAGFAALWRKVASARP